MNPRVNTLKKWFFEVLKEKYTSHDPIIERVGSCLVTERDMQEFGKLISEVFQLGYFKAINDYKAEFSKYGMEINVVPGDHQNLETSETMAEKT